MTEFESYWSKIYCINLASRQDKWKECEAEFKKFNLTQIERAEGVPWKENGFNNPNGGCTAAHYKVFEKILANNYQRTLILEDDFEIICEDFHKKWEECVKEIPEKWDMLYLGCHYGEKPKSKVSSHIIQINRVLTTSSYGISLELVKELLPIFKDNNSPPDVLFYDSHLNKQCYVLKPRLMVQRVCFSDVQGRECNNRDCMLDTTHENMV